jgi:hypothetical protein
LANSEVIHNRRGAKKLPFTFVGVLWARIREAGVGGKESLETDRDEQHLTGVGFEAKEAAAPYGKGVRKK